MTDALIRGERARQILEDNVISDAFGSIEATYMVALLNTPGKDDLDRFRLAEAIKVARLVRRHLAIAVENGKFEAHNLEQLQTPKRRWNLRG